LRDYQFIILVVLIFLAISYGVVQANSKLPGGGDFYVNWVGARVFLFDKIDPYGSEVPAQVQQIVYGGPLKGPGNPYILDTPFQLLPFYYLFSLISDPSLARAIFTLLLELCLIALAALSLNLAGWIVPKISGILFISLAIFNVYSFQAIIESSPVLILGLFFAGILYTHRANQDEVCGALIALSLYLFVVGMPFLLLVALRVIYEKKTRVYAGFIMLNLILFFISFLTYPAWIIPFWRASINYMRADFGFDIRMVFIHIWPSWGYVFGWIFVSLLLVLLGYEISLARSGDYSRFYWVSCLLLAAAPLLGFRTEMEHLSVLILPLALIFAVVHDRWRSFGDSLTIALMVAIFGLPWVIKGIAVNLFGVSSNEITFLFLPFSTMIGLYWIRWWAIRPKSLLVDPSKR
jgi:hypothetical protein